MLVIPAIDLLDGKCVRLYKGDYSKVTVYSDDPVSMAKGFVDAGAKRVVINSPSHVALRDGYVERAAAVDPSEFVPQIASIGSITLTNGGYEDE